MHAQRLSVIEARPMMPGIKTATGAFLLFADSAEDNCKPRNRRAPPTSVFYLRPSPKRLADVKTKEERHDARYASEAKAIWGFAYTS